MRVGSGLVAILTFFVISFAHATDAATVAPTPTDLEARRGQNLTSVTTTSRRRSHFLTAVVTTLITYAGTVHGSSIAHAGLQNYEAVKTTLLGLLGH